MIGGIYFGQRWAEVTGAVALPPDPPSSSSFGYPGFGSCCMGWYTGTGVASESAAGGRSILNRILILENS